MEDGQRLRDLGQQLRIDSVRAAAAAGSGHPTSSRSAADLMAVLIAHHLHYDALLNAIGAISNEELLTFRRFGSRLEGHQTPALPWVDVATGSLGQGLPVGVGLALAGKRLDRLPYRVWVLCGERDGGGFDERAVRTRRLRRPRQPDRDRRCEQAWAAGRDHARLGPRCVHGPRPGLRLARRGCGWSRRRGRGRRVWRSLDDPGRPTAIVAETRRAKASGWWRT